MSKAIIYLRVSTEEQAEKGFSIQAQREECIKKAKELGALDIIEYLDEGVSGSILERPMLLSSLEKLKLENIEYFISFDPSRLSRNVSHQLMLIDSIKRFGAKLAFVRSNYDESAEGRFQITIMAAVDEYERARLKVRTELGKRAKASQKLLTHNPGLYGYHFDKENDILLINEGQAQIVKLMYQWLLEEQIGPSEIAKKLNQMNIPSMRGKLWSRVAVNRILKNFSYTGTLYIRKYDTKDYKLNKYKKKEEKVHIKERPIENWVPITIPQIIEIDDWNRAKCILDKAKRIYKKDSKTLYLLSGLLKCGICGGSLFGRSTSKHGQIINRYYCCSNKYNSKKIEDTCSSKLIPAKMLEDAVWNKVKSMLLNKDGIFEAIEKLRFTQTQQKSGEHLYKLLKNKEEEKQKIITLFVNSLINEEDFTLRVKRVENALDKIQKEIDKNKETKWETDMSIENIPNIIEMYLEKLTIYDKNNLLQKLIKEVIINQDNIQIESFIH